MDIGPRLWSWIAIALLGVSACTSTAPLASSPPGTVTAAPSAAAPSSEATSAGRPPSLPPLLIVSPIPGAPDSGTTIALTAKGIRWSVTTLTAPAGKGWRIRIDDQDDDSKDPFLAHTFVVETGPAVSQRIFVSPKFGLGTHDFNVPALPAGTYTFLCTIHPDSMTGTLTIR